MKVEIFSSDVSDIIVVGGGIVGASVALGLAENQFKVTLIEHRVPPKFDESSIPDLRISAINSASVKLLKKLNIWHNVCSMRYHPYCCLKAWEWENSPLVFSTNDLGSLTHELGFMVENIVLQQALWNAITCHPQISVYCPSKVVSIQKKWPLF